MKLLRIIRSSEWWEYKLPPLLALGYATALQANKNIYDVAPWLAFLLLSIIVGAIYVSIVNDITDLKEDSACGKHNRLSGLSPAMQWGLLVLSIVPGCICAYVLADDTLTLLLYLASYLSFTLYSSPPFRLKKRGIAGVFADACGAHLFPSLLMVAGTSHFLNIPLNTVWFAAAGVWALMYGLRGILWHQFTDRENDLLIGLNTFATKNDPAAFKRPSLGIMAIELAALAVMLSAIGKLWPLVALLAYMLLLFGYAKRTQMKLITIVAPAGQPWHILMSTYYQVFLPLSLLFESALTFPAVWIVLAVHLLLFPRCIKHIILDTLMLARARASF